MRSAQRTPTAASVPPTVAEVVADELRSFAHHTFAVRGEGNAHFLDALDAFGAPVTTVRYESGAIAAADAYQRVSGKLGVASASFGPSFTNALTALAEASIARIPMIVVVGDQPESGPRPWDVDQEMLGAAMHVRTREVSVKNPARTVQRAVESALKRRRPVVLAMPYGIADQPAQIPALPDVSYRDLPTAGSVARANHDSISDDDLTAAAKTLAAAERPVIVAGRGAHLAGAGPALEALAERLGALTATTALARGIFGDSLYDLGPVGGFGQSAAMRTIAEADVALVVGAALNQYTTHQASLFGPGTQIVRIDIEDRPAPVSDHPLEHTLLRGDAKKVAEALQQKVKKAKLLKGRYRKTVKGLEPGGALREREIGSPNDPRTVAARIGELLPRDTYITSETDKSIGWANRFWPVRSPERILMVGTAFRATGLCLSTVVGIAAAHPHGTVAVSASRQGALAAFAELETAINAARSLIIVIWDDDGQSSAAPSVDFAAIAESLGARGVQVNSLSDLNVLETWVQTGAAGTILLDCRLAQQSAD